MVAKPKRSLIQRWFDEVFSDTVAELGRQTVAPKTFLLSETHRNDKRSHTCMCTDEFGSGTLHRRFHYGTSRPAYMCTNVVLDNIWTTLWLGGL